MTVSNDPPRIKYGVFALAIVLLLLGAGGLLMLPDYSLAKTLSPLLIVASVYFVRLSRVRSPTSAVAAVGEPGASSAARKRPGIVMWSLGGFLVVAVGVSFAFMVWATFHGYRGKSPMYLLEGTIVVCGFFWSYLIAKTFF